MKRFSLSKHVVLILAIVAFIPLSAAADWVLYDDFSSAEINRDKWATSANPKAAPVSIENGAAKFVLDTDDINISSWLSIVQSPETIKGIRVKVKFASQVLGVRGRAGGYVGTDTDGNGVWNNMNLQQGKIVINDISYYYQYAWYAANLLDENGNGVVDYLYGEFPRPISGTYQVPDDLTNEWVSLEILFSPIKFTYGLPDYKWYLKNYEPLFKIEKFNELTNPLYLFKGIGVRANNSAPSSSSCIVYFDDVYILR